MVTPWFAHPCGCRLEPVMGRKRKRLCEHGNLYEKQGTGSHRPRPARRRTSAEPDRDWSDARAKVDAEGACRICKRTDRPLETAHVFGREHDEPKVSRTTGEILQQLYVHPDRVFPACGPFPNGCHGDVDMRRVNYLQYLTIEEQVRAVRDAGGIEAARIRLAPVEAREERESSAYVPESPRGKAVSR